MAERDYYEILGIPRNADEGAIKKAYKRLAMKYHPDRNQGDKKAEAHFKEIQKAYAILSDAKKRAVYDQHGHAAFEQGGMGNGHSAGDFSDVFGEMFGDIFGGSRQRSTRGSDLLHPLELTLEEAVRGCTKEIQYPNLATCTTCQGSGAKAGSSPITCTPCRGTGQLHIRQGFFAVQQTCHHCQGRGKVVRDACSSCRGQGCVKKTKTLSVKIPPGVDSGDRIRLSGEGEAGTMGTPAGDLYIEFTVKPHSIFKRQDNNLYCEVPISFTLAALGGKVEVPVLNGKINLSVPPETQSGKLFRLSGKGVKAIRGREVGDLLCRVVVETPVKLNERQKRLLSDLEESFSQDHGQQHSPRSRNFFSGIKKFFEDLTRSDG